MYLLRAGKSINSRFRSESSHPSDTRYTVDHPRRVFSDHFTSYDHTYVTFINTIVPRVFDGLPNVFRYCTGFFFCVPYRTRRRCVGNVHPTSDRPIYIRVYVFIYSVRPVERTYRVPIYHVYASTKKPGSCQKCILVYMYRCRINAIIVHDIIFVLLRRPAVGIKTKSYKRALLYCSDTIRFHVFQIRHAR